MTHPFVSTTPVMFSQSIQYFILVLALAPSLVSAAIFPKDSKVKMLDAKGFNKAMKANEASMVAFVAPWCGHCQRLVPEYSKAATGLHPMVPLYAVDCDAEENKRLCGEQGVRGFPTIKMFPRGKELGSMVYEGERTAGAIFKWTSLRVPSTIEKLAKVDDINTWTGKSSKNPRAVLLTKEGKVPLLWKVLGNNFKGKVELGVHKDQDGSSAKALGLSESGSSKVLIYPAGSTKFAVYDGKTKMEPLTKFFKSVMDGSADLKFVEMESTKEALKDEL